jgi:hypothetical protein
MRWAAALAGVAALSTNCGTQFKNTAFQGYSIEIYGPTSPDASADPFKLSTQYTVALSYFEDSAGKVPYGTSLSTLPKGYETFKPKVTNLFNGAPAAGALTTNGKDATLPRLSATQTSFFVSAEISGLDSGGHQVARARCSLLEVKADPSGSLGSASCRAYYGAVGKWNTTSALAHPRVDFASVLLPDGRIVVAGGRIPSSDPANLKLGDLLDSIEIYDPFPRNPDATPGLWVPPADASTINPRFGLTATLLADGRVLFVGGKVAPAQAGGAAVPSHEVEIFNPNPPSSEKSVTVFSMLGSVDSRAEHAASLIGGNVVLIAGGVTGQTLTAASALDKIQITPTETFQSQSTQLGEVHSPCLATIDANTLLLCGGSSWQSNPPVATSSSCVILGAGDSQPRTAGSSETPRNQTRCALVNGVAFVVGGEPAGTPLAQLQIDLWQMATAKAPGLTPWAAEPYAMIDHALAVANGKVIVSGGRDPGKLGTVLSSAFGIDPTQNGAKPVSSMLSPRAGHQLIGLPDGSVMAIGGADGRGEIFVVPDSL